MSTIDELQSAFDIVDRTYTDFYGSAKPREKKALDKQWKIADRALAIAIKSAFNKNDEHIKDLTKNLEKAREELEDQLEDIKSAAEVIGAIGDVIRLMASIATLIAG